MMEQSILKLFPEELKEIFAYSIGRQAMIQEIRLRADRPIYVMEGGKECFLDRQGYHTDDHRQAKILSRDELMRIVSHICKYSMYAYEDELRQGFLTVEGGHRVGIVGQAVLENGDEIRTLKQISALNIRVSHQIIGAADSVLPHIYQAGRLQNTIIISPPGCGKTTLLRDMIRQVSDGNRFGRGISVGIVDERSEIAGTFRGCPQNDVGIRTDVLDSCPKAKGMMMLIRAMAPGAVAIDELGEVSEWKSLLYASYCGTSLLATMHGEDLGDYLQRRDICLPGQRDMFQRCIVLRRFLGKCDIERIYYGQKGGEWICMLQR